MNNNKNKLSQLFIINPVWGLCNRMRTVDSAISYKKERGEIFLILFWVLDSTCNEKFSNLFERPKDIDLIIEIKAGFFEKLLKKFSRFYFSHFSNYYIDSKKIREWKKISGSAIKSISFYLNNLPINSKVYLRTTHRFFYSNEYHPYSSFTPLKNIQNEIKKIDTKDMIGVHIRRKDNEKSIIYSPFGKFVQQMEHELKLDNTTSFYLATDDNSIKDALFRRFPNRIFTREIKSFDRNDPNAIKEGLIDLYSLANCRKIIGSYWSSFTEVAAEIYDKELTIVKDVNVNAI